MKKNRISLIAAVAFSVAGIAFSSANAADTATTVDTGKSKAACASGKCERGKRGSFMKDFGFTSEQLEKMNSLKMSFESSTGPKKAELRTLHKELRDGMTKPGVSKTELLSLQTKINGISNDLSTSRVNYMADKIALLTDDQKSKIREFSLKRNFFPGHGKGNHFRGGKGHFRGHGGPGPRASFGGDKKFSVGEQPASTPTAPVAPSEV